MQFAVLSSLFVAFYAYVLGRVIFAFGGGWALSLGLAVAATALHLGTFALRTGAVRSVPKGARIVDALAWLSYLLLGWFAFALVLSVVRDAAFALIWLADLALDFLPDPAAVAVWTQGAHASALGLATLMSGVGFLEARRRPRVKKVDVPIPGLPEGLAGFTIAQLTDIHVGPTIKRDFVEGLVDGVNREAPDLVAITGDLVDGSVEDLREHTAPLANLSAPHGVYVVTGNHEYYAGAEPWVAELRRLGLTVLMNEHEVVHDGELVVSGVADLSAGHHIPSHAFDPVAALAGAPEGAMKLMLAHQPLAARGLGELAIDLMLSGHTHGGQLWPWHLFVPLQQPLVAGLGDVDGTQVYVSRGSGYWGPPNRLGAPSEISLLRLVPAT